MNTTVPKFKELWRETEIFETVRKGAGDINVCRKYKQRNETKYNKWKYLIK